VASLRAVKIPLLLFDEVDAGIGGAVADTVGRLLANLARTHQVVVVTHLAQVAVHGARHYCVSKSNDGLQTQSSITALGGAARTDELARMLAGVISDASRATANELIARALEANKGA
jgi:DNA repair protein RecN (Recombination protein N)